MARIIYKEGCEGQNNLSSIEGIEIDLLNGQKALIYPKYTEKIILPYEERFFWEAKEMSEIEALKETDTNYETGQLLALNSPAALWVTKFRSDAHGIFCLPSLLAAMELQHQKEDIDALAETIEGADLLRDFTSYVWSCSRCSASYCWFAIGGSDYTYGGGVLGSSFLVVPTILKKHKNAN